MLVELLTPPPLACGPSIKLHFGESSSTDSLHAGPENRVFTMSIVFIFRSVVQMMSRPVITLTRKVNRNGITQVISATLNHVKDTILMDVKGIVCTSNLRVSQ